MWRAGLTWIVWCYAAAAQDLAMPDGAELTNEVQSALGSYALPTAAFADGLLPVEVVEGPIQRQSYRMTGADDTTLQILAPLRDQIVDAGYTILLDCKTRECGGFDFRFATEVLPGPGMYVDLTDFRFLSARNDAGSAISALVSRSATATYIQLVRVGQPATSAVRTSPRNRPRTQPPAATGPLAGTLETVGRVVLSDLSFETGSSSLGDGRFESLVQIARYLADHPDRQIAIVGHTDSVGSLDGNIALSRKRASSVLERLVRDHGVTATQLEAGGMGYLAPLESNLSAAGREANRRVEAVLTSTE